jgi:hypothetical protein
MAGGYPSVIAQGVCADGVAGGHPFQRFEREALNELWQMDFKGHFPLLSRSVGKICKAIGAVPRGRVEGAGGRFRRCSTSHMKQG